MKRSQEPEVPLNYFGKGKDWVCPTDPESMAWLDRKWQEWEAAHPEDPTGEKTLAAWETEGRRGRGFVEEQIQTQTEAFDPSSQPTIQVFHLNPDSPTYQVRLSIQLDIFLAFKRWCAMQGRSMSSVVTIDMMNHVNPNPKQK